MKLNRLFLAGCLGALAFSGASAAGWPSNYQGVMLQAFYWDSYNDTKWTNLTSQAEELSNSFDLIWVPNSAYCGGHQNMGYMPQYWFTNHNSSFGTESQLKTMISTFAEYGTGFIADVVINHRNGVSNWYNFPRESWNGKVWQLGLEHICSNDEMAYAAGQPKPTGAHDTGENFDGARDLDHTNATVQDNCKNYVKCLIDKYGYVGFRYDMVKGYSGYYNKIYNQYANPTFSVGEYFDGNYDAVASWIEATGKTSAAFDFPCKYAINDAFHSGDMRKLVWKANGTTDQPAGMIHFGYSQYAVTFVDNHDTYRDGSKFNGNVLAANAFILMSPGTPCIFLPHWKEHKAALKQLIAIRKAAGIHNNSSVRVLRSSSDCYMAEVTGTKGKVVVKIGPAMVSPDGWNDSQIRAAGNDYCVWSDANVQGGGDDPITYGPEKLYLLGNIAGNSWNTAKGLEFKKDGSLYTLENVTFATASASETYCFFNLCTALGASWDVVNGSTRYGSVNEGDRIVISQPADMTTYSGWDAGNCKSWTVLPGTYNLTADFKNMTITVSTAATGIDGLGEEDAAPVYYTLQGVRLDAPVKGTPMIVVRGGKAEKVIAY
ncbi:MAG: hypothetical protein K2O24_01800 [Muribaculaceae bacterium]|nr:hypothetical protein [Muribaculaceae bacterium]